MENERLSREEMILEYKEDMEKLSKYLPWLEKQNGKSLMGFYQGKTREENSISIPTYDPTLLSFVKEARETKLIEKNYQFIYAKYGIKTVADEWKSIDSTMLFDIVRLKAIFSRYILKGMVKANVWSEGVENEIYLKVLRKMKDLMEGSGEPLA